jgi:hypothetical protein
MFYFAGRITVASAKEPEDKKDFSFSFLLSGTGTLKSPRQRRA